MCVTGNDNSIMCGILCVLGEDGARARTSPQARAALIQRSARLRHRGPDGTGVAVVADCFMAHERLNIVDPSDTGAQPQKIELECGGVISWMCNGEIYNHEQLRRDKLKDITFNSGSDCAVIGHLYMRYGVDCIRMLDGVFALVIFDSRTGSLVVARDAMGISPVYHGRSPNGSLYFASELKAICDACVNFQALEPGHYFAYGRAFAAEGTHRWYRCADDIRSSIHTHTHIYTYIRASHTHM